MNQLVAPSPPARIALIQSCWHKDIVDRGCESFLASLEEHGLHRDIVDVIEVPGAFEIPLHAKLLAESGRYRAVVACGFVVNGGIYRHEFVAQAVINGLMQVQLQTDVPVFSVVLTPQQFHEHEQHRRFFFDHMAIKGKEAASACMRTLESLERMRGLAQVSEAAAARRPGHGPGIREGKWPAA